MPSPVRLHLTWLAPRAAAALLGAFAAVAPGCARNPEPATPSRLEPISVAPDFSAPDETGKLRTLSEFRGRPVVLYFYPKDGTPGCTREACAFRDEWQRLQAGGAQVLGVSIDSVESHASFKREHALPFPLLADPEGRVLAAYGVPRMPSGYASRTTFVIDAQGVIRRIFPEVDPAVHVAQVLDVLAQLAREGLAASTPAQAPAPVPAAHPGVCRDEPVKPVAPPIDSAKAKPPPPQPPVHKSELALGLPFRGQWFVVWGVDSAELNQHAAQASQRRAADLAILGPDGKTHRDDGKKNADYLAYGQEILAVADGTVETVIDGVPENEPGRKNGYQATGNLVVLRHADRLFSVYAHLQPNKIRVKPGQKVKRGAVLALAGNSGNSTEPHLHFQLQDGPRFDASWGVEAVFDGVTVERDGKTEQRAGYGFLKGDRVGQSR